MESSETIKLTKIENTSKVQVPQKWSAIYLSKWKKNYFPAQVDTQSYPSLINSTGLLKFWNDKGKKRHGTPYSVLTLPCIKLLLCSTDACGDSDFAESHLERSDSPHIQEFPDSCSAPCEKWGYKRDLQLRIVLPTLTAGQPLGSSRLITKLRTHAGRVSGAGQISILVDCECGVSTVHNQVE